MARYTRVSIEAVEAEMVRRRYRQIQEWLTDSQYSIALWQNASGFAVTYGQQISDHLDYAHAAQEIGECLLHALTCAGLIQED